MATNATSLIAQDRDALYYPYIDIQNIEWLKATLLCFPHIHRMVPSRYRLNDSDEIKLFRKIKGIRKHPLLIEDEPKYGVVDSAQSQLLMKIRTNYDVIREKYSLKENATRSYNKELYPIHRNKMIFNLLEFLRDEQLALVKKEGINEWFYLHPKLGKAVMSTIAITIASDKGLDIVTDASDVHHKVIAANDEQVFEELVRDESVSITDSITDRVDDIAELVMTTAFDLKKLSAEDIANLQNDGKDLRQFKNALIPIAASIPNIGNPTVRAERIQEAAEQVLEEWRKYKKSLPRFALDALVDATEVKFPEMASSIMLGATGLSIGIGAGLAIGLLTYSGVKVWRKYKENASSPYQYLSVRSHDIVDKILIETCLTTSWTISDCSIASDEKTPYLTSVFSSARGSCNPLFFPIPSATLRWRPNQA